MSEFILEREFDASRDLVWKAWTDPELFARWYGPRGATIGVIEFAAEVGGVVRFSMGFGERPPMFERWQFQALNAPAMLSFRQTQVDVDGNAAPPPMPGWPAAFLTTIEFEEAEGKTRQRMTWAPVDATDEELAGFEKMASRAGGGWSSAFEKLGELLADG